MHFSDSNTKIQRAYAAISLWTVKNKMNINLATGLLLLEREKMWLASLENKFYLFYVSEMDIYWKSYKGINNRQKLVLKKECVIYETYRSGIQLLGWFVDHTVERRGGRALPLYHPHKDRKRERRYLKGIPHNTWK